MWCHMKCYYCSISRLMVVIACLHLPDVPRKCTMSCSSVGCMSQMRDPTSHEFWACLKLLKELLYIYSVQILHILYLSLINVAKYCDLNLSFAKLKSFFPVQNTWLHGPICGMYSHKYFNIHKFFYVFPAV